MRDTSRSTEPLDPHELFFNRELSWLAFARRVLDLTVDRDLPLLERVKFVGIMAMLHDEFFMKRIGGLKQQIRRGVVKRSLDGKLPSEELAACREEIRLQMDVLSRVMRDEIRPTMRTQGIPILDYAELTAEQAAHLREYFTSSVLPLLTPLAVDAEHPFPFISGQGLNLAITGQDERGRREWFVRLKVPTNRPRWLRVPKSDGFVPLEQVIAANLDILLPGEQPTGSFFFRVTRGAEGDAAEVEEITDEDALLPGAIIRQVSRDLKARRFAGVVRLKVGADMPPAFTSLFLITFGVRITNLANTIATTPGYETTGGLILAMGDIGIVLFSMLFPDGKFVPRWLKFLAPLLVISMLGIYIFPSSPFFWNTMSRSNYLIVTTGWYVIGLIASVYRYFRHATLAQKQQIRWAFIGTMGPFTWFLIFQVLQDFIPAFSDTSFLATAFQIVSRLAGIFLFLMLPLFVTIAIAQAKLFDIDLLINRSIVYGILTIGLGLAFGLLFGLVSLIFKNFHQGDQSFMVAIVFSVSAGALFQPARKKLQRFVDRFFYHIQIDYQKTPAEIRAESETIITGKTLASYRDLKLIGRGGMAEVYSATSPKSRKTVAIKVLRAALAEDEQFRKRFMREAQIVSGLEHPNIVRMMDFGNEEDVYYIVMELLSGPDLNGLLRQEQQIPISKTIDLLRGVADALDYAHLQGLVHRDIKPSNVMLDSSTSPARAVLTDFGIAKLTGAHTRITNTGMVGTFDYIAPEQIQASADVDGRADVYALGVMTYQMITGRLPFERPNTGALLLAHLNAPRPDAREILPSLPRKISFTIQQAMDKSPQVRFATAGEFVNTLASV